jgi:hypothetical protein
LADVLIKVAGETNPPMHLFLGSDAYDMANRQIAVVQKDLENWKSSSVSTDFENAKAVA